MDGSIISSFLNFYFKPKKNEIASFVFDTSRRGKKIVMFTMKQLDILMLKQTKQFKIQFNEMLFNFAAQTYHFIHFIMSFNITILIQTHFFDTKLFIIYTFKL